MQAVTLPRSSQTTLAGLKAGKTAGKADFDFGQARREASGLRSSGLKRPGLTAGLIGFAFALSMLIPVTGKAEPHKLTGHASPSVLTQSEASSPDLLLQVRDTRKTREEEQRRGQSKTVPAVCAIRIDDWHNAQTWYSSNCMRDHGVRGDMPQRCSSAARLFGTRDRLFEGECLRRAGFRTERG